MEGRYTLQPPRQDGRPVRPDSGGLFVALSSSSRRPTQYATQPLTTLQHAPRCDPAPLGLYAPLPGTIAAFCFLGGILACFFGYRYFKATMFLTGFLFGSLVTYLICLEENLLPLEGKVGVSLGAGLLCGLITMLVQYVGVFMTGFHLGLLCAVAGLVAGAEALSAPPSTKWVPIGAVLGGGVGFALLGLWAQRGVTLVASAAVGGAMMGAGLDYFLELHAALWLVAERLRAERGPAPPCWYAWAMLALVPALALLGTLVQWRVSARHYHHNHVVQSRGRRHKAAVLHGGADCVPMTAPAFTVDPRRAAQQQQQRGPNNYRHLYQIRRANGDVIAQNYVCHMQEGRSRRFH